MCEHDNCSTNYAHARDVLQRQFPNRWIECGGQILWSAHSLDLNTFLTLLDYFSFFGKGV